MSLFRPNRIVNPEVLSKLDRANFLAFVEPHIGHFAHWKVALPTLDPDEKYDFPALAAFLLDTTKNHPVSLIDTLFYVDPLCIDEAHDELVEELEELGHTPPEGAKYSTADWVIFAWRVDPDVVVRLFPRYSQRPGRSVQHYPAKHDELPPIQLVNLPAAEAACSGWFKKKRRGAGTTIRHALEKDGTHSFVIRHGEPFARIGIMEANEPAAVGHPESYDLVQVQLNPPCLLVVAKRPAIQRYYRTLFGDYLFGDADAFMGKAPYTLDPLRGSARHVCEDCLVPGLTSVALTELHYNFGGVNEERLIRRGKNLAVRYGPDGQPSERILPNAAPTFCRLALKLKNVEALIYLDVKPPYTARPSRPCSTEIINAFLSKAEIMNGVPENAHQPAPEPVGAP